MKTYNTLIVTALALASIGSSVVEAAVAAAPPLARQLDQVGSAIGVGGTGGSSQHNDYSHVAPGNDVINGGAQSASLQGIAGSVLQRGNGVSNILRRDEPAADDQAGGATGYGGTAVTTQDNDFSHVAPGNKVHQGGSQHASLNGEAGSVLQGYNPGLLGLLKRRIDQEGGASGYAGHSGAYQDNDLSGVAPGNDVQVGGTQSSSNTGAAGSVDQWFERARLARRVISPNAPTLNTGTDGNRLGLNLGDHSVAPATDVQQYPTSCAQGGSTCVPHYLGLEPVERPAL
ncbi:hypothetical protein EX895_001560 [Sporisorium graminicola]|uniref:Uncharacterized protein n=1 Tax=Sporisorium graminicola TaxID=280036 RepID=A0A4V6EU33_9BASI|nr:hypothetical protein EX895_001560 [Sporisorium graminicola]TKY89029.1 hypothetical protein EX895_001560 [Sporisorium graminicola]